MARSRSVARPILEDLHARGKPSTDVHRARDHGVDHKTPEIGLATERFRAIDLSCRACGAGAWALGLDSRLGTPASLPFSTPNLQLILRVVAELGILRVVAELQNS